MRKIIENIQGVSNIKPKVRLSETHRVKRVLRKYKLHTVCEESLCPNISECFGHNHTATFLLMGNICTRHCAYCNIKTMKSPPPPDPEEPENLRKAVEEMGISYVVLTSPDRDDLPDKGAKHLARCVKILKDIGKKVEILSPDLGYDKKNWDILLSSQPDVFAHNIEVVPRLYPKIRPKGDYKKSLLFLEYASNMGFTTKTSLILGLGEKEEEVYETLKDIRETGCKIITMGQYYQPSLVRNKNVERFVIDWDKFKKMCEDIGFEFAFVGPNVRSSYLADKVYSSFFSSPSSLSLSPSKVFLK